MIDEVTKSIKAQLYDRVSSPLFSSFLISWVVWNYKFILVILSSSEIREKFSLIDYIFPDWSLMMLNGAIYPLLTALAIIFIYPYPARFIYRYSRLRHQELKVIQTEIDDATPMTKDEARKFRRDALTKSEELESQLEKTILDRNHLKERIVELQKEIAGMSSESVPPVESSKYDHPKVQEPNLQKPDQNDQNDQKTHDVTFKLPNLNEEAQELLLEAVDDKSGTILHARYIGGTSIQTNGKNQIPSGDRETIATWESALRELVKEELVEGIGNKDEVFQVTFLGYKVAKHLSTLSSNVDEKEFAREVTDRLKGAIKWDVLTDITSPIFLSLFQEYLDNHVPQNIAMKTRHQQRIIERLRTAFMEMQTKEIQRSNAK